MMDVAEASNDDAALNFSQEGVFYRPADRESFEQAVRALAHEGRCVALVSASEGVVDHYGRMLFRRLREEPGLQLEVHFPSSTDWLLSRFNELLAPLTIAEATGARSALPARVMVVNDAATASAQECQLLARLLHDFPACNLRIAFLVHARPGEDFERVLEPFGRQLLRWEAAAPSAGEAGALLQAARDSGFEPEAVSALRQAALRTSPESAAAAAPGASLPPAGSADKAPAEAAAPRRRRATVARVAFAAALAALGAWALMQPAQPTREPAATAEQVGSAAPGAPRDPAPEGAEPIAESKVDEKPAAPVDSGAQGDPGAQASGQATAPAAAGEGDRPESASAASGAAPGKAPAGSGESLAATQPGESVAAAAPGDSPAAAEVAARGEDEAAAIVRGAADDRYFVQHAIVGSMAAVRRWERANAADYPTLAVPIRFRRTTQIAVLSGPFEGVTEARSFVARLRLEGRWVRRASTIKADLADAR